MPITACSALLEIPHDVTAEFLIDGKGGIQKFSFTQPAYTAFIVSELQFIYTSKIPFTACRVSMICHFLSRCNVNIRFAGMSSLYKSNLLSMVRIDKLSFNRKIKPVEIYNIIGRRIIYKVRKNDYPCGAPIFIDECVYCIIELSCPSNIIYDGMLYFKLMGKLERKNNEF